MSVAITSPSNALQGARAAAVGRDRVALVSRLLRSGLLLGGIVVVFLAAGILVGLGGLDYYTTAAGVRAYAPAHRLLRPSGPAGQMFGIVGTAMMLMPFAYAARKRFGWMRHMGPASAWLELHLFCGIVGPVLVTFHTSFKFNGIVSVAYWSMVLVMLSGFAGRFLYLRIPRSMRGVELTRAELDARSTALESALAGVVLPDSLRHRVARFGRDTEPGRISLFGLLFGELQVGWRVRALAADLATAGTPVELRTQAVALAVERAMLVRRIAYLQRTTRLFALWHVFHLPLVWLMLVIVTAHVAVAFYLGYVPFRW
jgi:hypothetical protein